MNNWSYFLLNITMPAWHLYELNAIIAGAEQTRATQSLAFFSLEDDSENYIEAFGEKMIPKIVATRNYGDVNFKDVAGINSDTLFVAVGSLDRRALWNHINDAFNGMQTHIRGIFITTRSARNDFGHKLEEHLKWCWQRGFTNALVLVDNGHDWGIRQFEIFSYNPFLDPKLLNVTLVPKANLFPDKFRNFYQHRIRTCTLFDPPRVFERKQCSARNNELIVGYVANVFRAFVQVYNASVQVINDFGDQRYKLQNIVEILGQGDIDVVINPYVTGKGTVLSYPIRMVQRCVVVPFASELPKYKYFIMPFDNEVWLCFLGMWFVMSLSRILGLRVTHRHHSCRVFDVSQIFLEVWRQIIFLPIPPFCCHKALYWYSALWFLHTFVLGFILSNLYLASLTSFFSGLTFQRQISTLAELVDRRLSIEIVDDDIQYVLQNEDLPEGFSNLLKPRSSLGLLQDILAMRPGMTYIALSDRIVYALSQQEHLLKPLNHIVEECISTVPLGFVMPFQSQLELPLHQFILRVASAGLIDKWIKDSILDGQCSGILHNKNPQFNVARPLMLEHFQFGWYVLAGGYLASFTIFLIENLKRVTRRFRVFVVCY